jgi:hypothetical protein
MHANHRNTGLWDWLRLAFAGLVLSALAACTESLDTNVTRFGAPLPAPAGQSFAVVAGNPALAGGIEFGQYAHLVAAELVKQGYVEAPSSDAATLIVRLDYGVDTGRTAIESTPDPYWGPWRGYHGFGGYRHGPWGWGWNDPWFDSGIDSYTVYTSGINLKIDARDGKRLFEGKAEAVSTSNKLSYLVPNLIEAMFTGFPGDSGKTVRISVAPEKAGPQMAPAGK